MRAPNPNSPYQQEERQYAKDQAAALLPFIIIAVIAIIRFPGLLGTVRGLAWISGRRAYNIVARIAVRLRFLIVGLTRFGWLQTVLVQSGNRRRVNCCRGLGRSRPRALFRRLLRWLNWRCIVVGLFIRLFFRFLLIGFLTPSNLFFGGGG